MSKKIRYRGHGRYERRLSALDRLNTTLENGVNYKGKDLTDKQKKRIEKEIQVLKNRTTY